MANRNFKTFSVDISSILAATEYLNQAPIEVIPRLAVELQELARNVLFNVFYAAMPVANAQGGFPAPFQDHVLTVLRDLPILATVSGPSIQIIIDFDLLGDSDDLERAFHQGAKLADGGGRDGYLWGPYEGQDLTSENPLARYHIWNVVYEGYSEFKFGRKSQVYRLPDWASWEATMQQRISIWGNKAPEWLYIEYGQQDYYPKVPVGSVFEDFNTEFLFSSRELFAAELDRLMTVVNSFEARGVPATVTPGGRIRVTQGRFAGSIAQPNIGQYVRKITH